MTTIFTKLLIICCSSPVSLSHKVQDVYSYVQSFLEFNHSGTSANQHYLNGTKMLLAAKHYLTRVISSVHKTPFRSSDLMNILLGCSTAESFAYPLIVVMINFFFDLISSLGPLLPTNVKFILIL